MSLLYLSILNQIEDGSLTVQQAIKKIEKYSKKQQKLRAKKMKLLIIDGGKQLYLPEVSLSMMNCFFKLCAPFIKINQDEKQKFSKEEFRIILIHLEEVLKLMKDYPPLDLIAIQSNKTIIKIMTK